MITSVEITRLRGIASGKLEGLTPLTILVGPNGCGKSTVLDALLIGAASNPGEAVGYSVRRRAGIRLGARWLIRRAGADGPSEIRLATENAARSIRLSLSQTNRPNSPAIVYDATVADGGTGEAGRTATRFAEDNSYEYTPVESSLPGIDRIHLMDFEADALQRPIDQVWTEAGEVGHREIAESLITQLTPGATRLEIGTYEGSPLLYIAFKQGTVPVALAGEGIQWLVRICLGLATSESGAVLIEEPESHQHPGAIRQTARAIWAAVERGIQVALSTHSLEMIDSLISQASEHNGIDQITVFSLKLVDGCLRANRINGPDAAFLRGTIAEDLR